MRSSIKMTRKNGQLYILEKIWKISYPYDFIFKKDGFDYAFIRPCNVDYKTYNDFMLGKKTAPDMIRYEGSIAVWPSDPFSSRSYEEFLVDVNVNKLIFPLFENWIFSDNWKKYTVKTIDLKTNKVLFDITSQWLSERRRCNLI